jgi:hypothetical protein
VLRESIFLVLAACTFDTSVVTVTSDGGPPGIDANGDGSLPNDSGPVFDADPACAGATIPFEPSNFTRCDLSVPTTPITLTGGDVAVIDTDDGTININGAVQSLASSVVPQTGGPDLLVISTDDVSVPATASLAFRGTRPIAIASLGTIDIGGRVDMRGVGTSGAPGSNSSSCGEGDTGVAQTGAGTSTSAASGGGGGGYGGVGGSGAAVPNSGVATPGGDSNGNATIIPLRGGCNGGAGGNASSGEGGGGGGALQLVASGMIFVRSGASVTASGGGGVRANNSFAAGGGGGSGGALLFEAPMIQIDGAVTANGGGGGQGNRGGVSTDSENGEDGHSVDAVPAAGGNSALAPSGGSGGDGGSSAASAENGFEGINDATRSAGGGGGGGSVGRIRLNIDATPSTAGLVSPAPG